MQFMLSSLFERIRIFWQKLLRAAKRLKTFPEWFEPQQLAPQFEPKKLPEPAFPIEPHNAKEIDAIWYEDEQDSTIDSVTTAPVQETHLVTEPAAQKESVAREAPTEQPQLAKVIPFPNTSLATEMPLTTEETHSLEAEPHDDQTAAIDEEQLLQIEENLAQELDRVEAALDQLLENQRAEQEAAKVLYYTDDRPPVINRDSDTHFETQRPAGGFEELLTTGSNEVDVSPADDVSDKKVASEENMAPPVATLDEVVIENLYSNAPEVRAQKRNAVQNELVSELDSLNPHAKPWQKAVPKDYTPIADSTHELLHLNLPIFAGPLDLLLFLIRRHELDILDIPIAFMCTKYLGYLKHMEELNIDVAAEFLLMAAELVHIKSKMLLPQPVEVEDEEEDPRADLVRRLLEYQKYKNASQIIAQANWLGRNSFQRPRQDLPVTTDLQPLREVGVYALVKAFDAIIKRQKPEVRHQIRMEQISIKSRIRTMIATLQPGGTSRFEEFVGTWTNKIDVIVTFLAILEMARMRLIRVFQATHDDDDVLYMKTNFVTHDEADETLSSWIEEASASVNAGVTA